MIYYTDPRAALDKLMERQESGARDKVEELWSKAGIPMPTLGDTCKVAILARQLATARFEDLLFHKLALDLGFLPAWWPHSEDKFVSCSPLKRSYLYPHLCLQKDRVGLRTRRKRLADITLWEGKKLSQIVTVEGEQLVEWHKRRQQEVMGMCSIINAPACSYPLFLSLFVAHGVLFEDFQGGESGGRLGSFTTQTVVPAFQKVSEAIGLAPIIVRLPWWPELGYYPSPGLSLVDVMRQEDIVLLSNSRCFI